MIFPSFHCFHSEYFQSALKRPEVATVPTPSLKDKHTREEEEEEEVEVEEVEEEVLKPAAMSRRNRTPPPKASNYEPSVW
jgi:hypothetical protein